MTLIDLEVDENEIKRYLFAEIEPGEREGFEERLFQSDELFFEVADIENRLVDGYVRGKLASGDLARFERSLESVPGRRQKVANARSLHELIGEARPTADPIEVSERRSIWQRLMGGFGGRTRAFTYAMVAMLLLLMASTGVLIFQNRQKSSELARLQVQQGRQEELQKELDLSRQRERDLRNIIDSERDASADISDELEREHSRREEIERELGKLKNDNARQPKGTIIASVLLLPTGGRGGNGGSSPDVNIGNETKRLSMHLSLPDTVTQDDRLTVRLNQKVIVKDVAPRISGGKKSINVSVPTVSLVKGKNQIDVLDADERAVGDYGFNVIKK
jgi:hypothetical protein